MATETGTATDYKDLLQKLKIFLTGTGSPESGLSWVVEEERSSFTSPLSDIPDGDLDQLMDVAAQNDQDSDQIIFRGNGGTSPEKEIYFAIQTMGLSTTGYYNWQIRGLTGFATKSPEYVALGDQPGRSPPAYILLQNTPMTYWFIGNNRRVMGSIKTGSSYQPFYIGFLNPYATDAEYPYPMMIAGTAFEEDKIFSDTGFTVSSFINPTGFSSSEGLPVQGDLFPAIRATAFCRFVDGNWYQVSNYNGSSSEVVKEGDALGNFQVYPHSSVVQQNAAEGNKMLATDRFKASWMSGSSGGTPNRQFLPALGSPGQALMWPMTVIEPSGHQFIGDFDGCYWIPGAGGVTSEDTFTDSGESPEVTHIAFQSVWRTDAWLFMAMRNE